MTTNKVVKIDADFYKKSGSAGFTFWRMRDDVGVLVDSVRKVVNGAGGILPSAGGFRDLNDAVTSGRSAVLNHYSGLAFDIHTAAAMQDPLTDPLIVVKNGSDDPRVRNAKITWTVYVRVKKDYPVITLPAWKWAPSGGHPVSVTDRFLNLTELLGRVNFTPIGPRSEYPAVYSNAEWWHFENISSYKDGVTTFGQVLSSMHSATAIQQSPPGAFVNYVWSSDRGTFVDPNPSSVASAIPGFGGRGSLQDTIDDSKISVSALDGSDKKKDSEFKGDALETSFQMQCALLDNIEALAPINYNTYFYKNFTPIHGDSSILVSNLTSRKNSTINHFLNIEPLQLANITPQIRLYKIFYESTGEINDIGREADSLEYKFDEFLDLEREKLFESGISRGSGVGLMSFDWKFQGTNPAEASNIIEASLKLRFSSLAELERERTGRKTISGEPEIYRFINLILPSCKKLQDPRKFNPDYYSFKIIVGWSSDFETNGDKNLENLKKELAELKSSLILTLTTHEIDFRQDGSAILTINCNARYDVVAQYFENDVFKLAVARNAKQNLIEGENELLNLRNSKSRAESEDVDLCNNKKHVKDEKEAELLRDEIRKKETEILADKEKIYQAVLGSILKKERIKYIVVPYEAVFPVTQDTETEKGATLERQKAIALDRATRKARYPFRGPYNGSKRPISTGTSFDHDERVKALKESHKKNIGLNFNDTDVEASAKLDGDYFKIPFFYFGDLIDVAMEVFYENPANKNIKTLLSDITIYRPDPENFGQGKKISVNLADIPISIQLYQEFFIKNIYEKQLSTYPLKRFIADIVETLLVRAIAPNGCYANIPSTAVKVATSFFSTTPLDGQDRLRNSCGRTTVTQALELPKVTNAHQEYFDYFLIYTNDTTPSHLSYAKLKEIVHYFTLGRDRGLVKEINFTKQDQQYVREAFLTNADNPALSRLGEPYIATIEMIGNNLFLPGQLIFVNPSTLLFGIPQEPSVGDTKNIKYCDGGDNALQGLRIVGFFFIKDVENFIEPGKFSTKLTCWWQATGSGKGVRPAHCPPETFIENGDNWKLVLLSPETTNCVWKTNDNTTTTDTLAPTATTERAYYYGL